MKHIVTSVSLLTIRELMVKTGSNIIGQYTHISTNNAQELNSNVTQTEKENIFCLCGDLNLDLYDERRKHYLTLLCCHSIFL
jgi:hypothetical protein